MKLRDMLREKLSEDIMLLNRQEDLQDFISKNTDDDEVVLGTILSSITGYNFGREIYTVSNMPINNRAETLEEVKKKMLAKGLQEKAVQQCVDFFVDVLDITLEEKLEVNIEVNAEDNIEETLENDYKEDTQVEYNDEIVEVVKDVSMPQDVLGDNKNVWTCSCGNVNIDLYCSNCGKQRDHQADSWICSCGQANYDNFCVSCGKKRNDIVNNEPLNRNNTVNNEQTISKENIHDDKKYKGEVKSSNKKSVLIAAVALLILVGGANLLLGNNKDNSSEQKNNVTSAINANTVSTNDTANDNRYNEKDLQVKSDMSLGGIQLGDKKSLVEDMYGKPDKIDSNDKRERWYYKELQVVFNKSGIVTALVSEKENVRTKRGFHQGSMLKDIVDSYGESKMKYEDGSLLIYEYRMPTNVGVDGLLRYAINKNDKKVNYISIRIPEEWMITEVDEKNAKDVFITYHNYISNGKIRDAYNLLSDYWKEQIGTFDSYAPGYKNTISSQIDKLDIVSKDDGKIVFNYNLTARDKNPKGILVKKFVGTTTMVKVDDVWKISITKSEKVKEYIEK